ncbi:HupE/UreJ family protein [Alteraurantiacibacter palmitatis]|uniref:HupE/UreJ family protein n=1 Tax=Alteraurantiacibacter palmitatis TaxID=2054628 RepID=A0ABV7E6Q9_9SPHN
MRAAPRHWPALAVLALASVLFMPTLALAHDVAEGDKAFVLSVDGPAIFPFLYLGAKHMVTGYDHIAFLVGVVFFLSRLRDVVVYVSMFTIGHSLTLIGGVLLNTGANAYIIDAIIGLSVIYKGVENIGGFRRIGWNVDTRLAVLVFGLFHGMGLATKVLDLGISQNGLLANLLAFNVGVELGQVLVLAFVVSLFAAWRARPSFTRYAFAANVALIAVGLVLTAIQIEGYLAA